MFFHFNSCLPLLARALSHLWLLFCSFNTVQLSFMTEYRFFFIVKQMQSSWKWYSLDPLCLANTGFSFLLSLSQKDSILLTVHWFASPELMISWVFQMHHHNSRKPGFLWDLHIRILSINILYLRGNPSVSHKLHTAPYSTLWWSPPSDGADGLMGLNLFWLWLVERPLMRYSRSRCSAPTMT